MLFKSKDEKAKTKVKKQKAKTSETKSKDIKNKKQRLVIDAEMRTKISILFFIRMQKA